MTETGTETYTTETGEWGWTASGSLWCSTCGGEQSLPCTAQPVHCWCEKPRCVVCADPDSFCEVCDNTGEMTCPTCEN